jgi:phytoene/squalene synthetase
VGRLVLLVFEQDDPELLPLSDAICTGLQLANHWQDVAIDYRRDRIYVPEELMQRHGVSTWDFSTGQVSDGFRGLMGELIGRTRALFHAGRPLCDRVGRELRFEMRLTWLGGMSILDRIEAVGADVFRRRPHHSVVDKAALAWRAWRWSSP